MPKIDLLIAQANDYPYIASIYNFYIDQEYASCEENHHTAEMIHEWVKQFNDRERLFIIKADGQSCGWCIIKRYSDRGGYAYACETAVYLSQSHIGKGIGGLVKTQLFEICSTLNYKHLVSKIFKINKASIAYNLKLGYEIVGTQKQIAYKAGKWHDIIILQKII